jgi:nicotinate-nucleotide adenylyltransferase
VNIAIFGGTFDPIHSGHLRAAKAAARKFHLDRILFVPTGHPPHKASGRLTAFEHRYAMVALACAGNRNFVPSLLEAPSPDGRPSYSIETVERVRRSLRARDRLYFIVGADAFLDLPHWRDFRRLLESADFIVVSRPGFKGEAIGTVIPKDFLPRNCQPGPGRVPMRRSTLYTLQGVHVAVASREIRNAVRKGRRPAGCVPPLVEQYIRKEGLYLSRSVGEGQ